MAKFEIDTEFVRKLAQLLHETDLGEIELADGDKRIRVARPAVTVAAAPVAAAPLAVAAPPRGRRRRRRRQATSASIPAR